MYLNCHTYYSLKYGILSPEKLVQLAKKNAINQLALTDINNTSAHFEFIKLCQKANIKPIIGIDFRNGIDKCFIALAKNNKGYKEINLYLSHYLHTKSEIPTYAPDFENVWVIYPYSQAPKQLKEYEYIGVTIKEVERIRRKKTTIDSSRFVLGHTVTFEKKGDLNTHRLLRAIDTNNLLSKLPPEQEASSEDLFLSKDKILSQFHEFPEIIEKSESLLNQCTIDFEFGTNQKTKNLSVYTTSANQDFKLLKKLCYMGLSYRYPSPDREIYERVEKELSIIRQKNFVAYFLINWDIITYAQSKNYFYVGRGSGANSIVAYLLQITDVDPIELDLYFERFINLYRQNPPDFDIDFSWKDREDIINYIFNRFDNVVLLATYNTFQPKATIRELGKVFGLPKYEIDKISRGRKSSTNYNKFTKLIHQYGPKIHGFPSHLSVHASGILITKLPIYNYSATSLPPVGLPIAHFDMVIAEDIGMHKFDILSQRGLGKIKSALNIITELHPDHPEIDIHDMNMLKEDKKVKELLRNAKTIGCFYVESPALRMLLTKLKAETYLGLVAASSIIRPGVAKSGMMREYIHRFKNQDQVKKRAHPILLNLMPETFGVMVYQEDVIKVAHYFAGLTLEEADYLRRGMSGKFRSRSEFQETKEKYFANCTQRNISQKDASDVWKQIESFAGYAFSKGHSASYAVESYQSLYLKAYYPLEFMVAVLNNSGGFYRTEIYLHEARLNGAIIEPPCVNRSWSNARLLDKTILLGLNFLHDFEQEYVGAIINERNRFGPYTSIKNFSLRVNIPLSQLKNLITVGAFRFTDKSTKELFWELHLYIQEIESSSKKTPLFEIKSNINLPKLSVSELEMAFQQIEVLGYHLFSPFNLLYSVPINIVVAKDLGNHLGLKVEMVGYLVSKKFVKSTKGEMYFGTFLDQNGDFFDTVIFPETAKKYSFEGIGVYHITGKVVEEYDFLSLETISMRRLPITCFPRWVSLVQY